MEWAPLDFARSAVECDASSHRFPEITPISQCFVIAIVAFS
jgi:hypothetical protein